MNLHRATNVDLRELRHIARVVADKGDAWATADDRKAKLDQKAPPRSGDAYASLHVAIAGQELSGAREQYLLATQALFNKLETIE